MIFAAESAPGDRPPSVAVTGPETGVLAGPRMGPDIGPLVP